MSLTRGAAAAGLVLLAACGGAPEPAALSLLGELRPSGAAGAAAATPRLEQVGTSWRRAVRTAEGNPLTATIGGHRTRTPLRLELAVAALRGANGSGGPVEVTVELAADGEAPESLLRDRLVPADGWVRHTVELKAGRRGELSLRSRGASEVAWAGLTLLPAEPPEAADPRPNLILVSLDTVRADHLSLYGYPRATSPNLDRFAADAWVFANARSTSTWTLPTHGTMFTGLLPDRHGLRGIEDTLADEAVTVAERLADAGYRTAAITDGGFLDPRWGLAQGFESYDVSPGLAWEPKDAAAIFGKATRWVRESRHGRPFFLFVHSYEAHQPYVNRGGFADPFLDPAYSGPFTGKIDILKQARDIRPRDHARIRALYDGGIRRLDYFLGIFLREVERRGLLENTAVLITSDHGEELGEHGGWEHVVGKLFDENVRVPMVLRPPGGRGEPAAADRFPPTPVSTLDVAPTLLQLAGIDPAMPGDSAPPLAGRSLTLLAEEEEPDRTVLLHGLNSVATLPARGYRLDRGHRSLLFDALSGGSARYDRRLDPSMRRPRKALGDRGEGRGLIARLQLALAWLDSAAFAVRLPPGTRTAELPAGAGFSLQGAWSGLERQEADALRFSPGLPATLLVAPTAGGGSRELEVSSAEPAPQTLRLEPLPAEQAFHPLDPEMPPPGTLIPSPRTYRAITEAPSGEQRRELEALGYL